MPDTSTAGRRNIVLILCDQLRPDFLHAYGADFIPTPNLDALAENGVVFENSITASTVCAPARAAVVTGRFVSDHDGWTNNIPLRSDVEYLPQRLNAAGYMTAAVGCYDHAPIGNPIGYRYLYRFEENQPGSEYVAWLKARHPEVNLTHYAPTIRDENGVPHFAFAEEEFYDRWSCDRATDFIESYTRDGSVPAPAHITGEGGGLPEDKNAPFFLYCGFLTPHAPYAPVQEMSGKIDPSKLPDILTTDRDEDIPAVERNRRAFLNPHEAIVDPQSVVPERQKLRVAYCEMVCEIDALVGRIVAKLKECGVYENTTILFSSDHGSCENDYNMSTKGPWPYSPQLFVPLIVSNQPGVRGRSDCLCGNLDIGATALDIAGDDRAFGVSRSLIGMATGAVPQRRVNMSEFCDSCKTLVDKRYTFTYYPFTGVTALYDRVNDPDMTTNIGGRPEVADIERRFLMDVIDFLCIAKGVRIEAHDMVPQVKEGLAEKNPKWLDTFDIAYPLGSMTEVERIREAGLDADFDEFCKTKPVKAHYGCYFLPRK